MMLKLSETVTELRAFIDVRSREVLMSCQFEESADLFMETGQQIEK